MCLPRKVSLDETLYQDPFAAGELDAKIKIIRRRKTYPSDLNEMRDVARRIPDSQASQDLGMVEGSGLPHCA